MTTLYARLSPRQQTRLLNVVVPVGTLLLAAAAGRMIALNGGEVPKALAALLGLLGLLAIARVPPESLFLGWLFLAPIMQESADQTAIGRPLVLALYVAPALILVLWTAIRFDSTGFAPYDFIPIIWVAFVLASLILTTDLFGDDPVGSVRGVFQATALGVVVYFFVAFGPGRRLGAERIVGVVLWAAALQAALSIVEGVTNRNLWGDPNWNDGIPRSIGTLANPAVLGAFIGVGIVVSLAVLGWDGPASLRRPAWVMLATGLPGLYFTYTRGPVLATVVVALLLLLASRRLRPVGILAIVTSCVALWVVWPRLESTAVYQERVAERTNVEVRQVIQDWSIRLWKEKPMFGWGYHSFDDAKNNAHFDAGSTPVSYGLESTSHNTYLTMIVEYGAIGVALAFLPFVLVLGGAVRRLRAAGAATGRWILVGSVAAIATIVLDGMTLDYRFFSFLPMVPWLFLGLARRLPGRT